EGDGLSGPRVGRVAGDSRRSHAILRRDCATDRTPRIGAGRGARLRLQSRRRADPLPSRGRGERRSVGVPVGKATEEDPAAPGTRLALTRPKLSLFHGCSKIARVNEAGWAMGDYKFQCPECGRTYKANKDLGGRL